MVVPVRKILVRRDSGARETANAAFGKDEDAVLR